MRLDDAAYAFERAIDQNPDLLAAIERERQRANGGAAGGQQSPTIILNPGEIPIAVDQAEEILLKNSEWLRLFQRGTELVRIVSLRGGMASRGLKRPAGTVVLLPVSQTALTEILDRLIVWQRSKQTASGPELRRVDVPEKVASTYMSRVGDWRLPELSGIICAPIMRPDGTILHRAGYDPETGLLLTEDWPRVAGNPTRGDALHALDVLLDPFTEFPFVAEEDRSVFVAGVLTALQRRLLESAPLFGFTAPTQRTGKSMLAESIAIISTGRPAPAMAVSGDREEMRKAVAAALREGHSVVNLDNVEHPLGSPDLSRAITQPEYADRILGETRIIKLPTNLMWTATGNNLTFRGDLAVRALVCRLDARVERPEERTFRLPDFKSCIARQRRELVVAALTILRAYAVAGRPDQDLKPWGGFAQWSEEIRSALVWLGMADPCATRAAVIENDPDREAAATVFSVWNQLFADQAIPVSEAIKTAESTPDLKAALVAVAASKNDAVRIDARRLSWWCREWRDRVVQGLRLEHGKRYGSHATWRVVPSADTADSADRFPSTEKNQGKTRREGFSAWGENIGTIGTDGKLEYEEGAIL